MKRLIKLPNPIIAAIDIGTNSFHLLIAQIGKNNKLKSIYTERKILRLTSELGQNEKVISENELNKSVKILNKFHKIADRFNASIFAIATSALREAENKAEFIKKVKQKTGIKINIITGNKEAEYIYQGMQTALPLKNKKVLCIDIGGGSTEIILGKNSKAIFSTSINVGAVRMTNKFFPDFILDEKKITSCKNYVEGKIKDKKGMDLNVSYDLVVGASGTIHAASAMINYIKYKRALKNPSGFIFTKKDFDNLYDYVLNKKTPIQRFGIKGLEVKRADIIPAGLIILSTIFELFKIKKITLSENALRSGIVYDSTFKLLRRSI